MNTYRILSIDAWRGETGWTWNNWYSVGTIDAEEFNRIENSSRSILAWLRKSGYLSQHSAGRVAVEDDGYNLVIVARGTREPVFAIEYGAMQ